MRIIITVPDSLPMEQIQKIRSGQWHLDVSGFHLIQAEGNDAGVAGEISGQCENIRFHPVSTPIDPSTIPADPYEGLVALSLPKFEEWFLETCKVELRTIREQSLNIRKKMRLQAAPDVPPILIGAIAAAAATNPKSKNQPIIESVRPYLIETIKALAVTTQAYAIEKILAKR